MKLDKSNWAATRLEDVAYWYQKDIPNSQQEASGVRYYLTADHIDSDAVIIKRYSELSDGQKGPTITKHFEKGDLLFSTRSTALHKAAIAPVTGVTGEKLIVVRVKPDSQLIPELLPFVMQSTHFWDFAVNSAAGSVNKFTSWTKIREYEFLLPPLDQQNRLAELLWAAHEVEEKYNALKTELIRIQHILIDHHSDGENDYRNLTEVIVPKKRVSSPPHKLSRYVGLEQIEPGAFTCEKYIDSKLAIANCFEFSEGDVLYSKLRPYLDKAFLASFQGVCTTELLVLNTTDECLPDYLLLILHSTEFISYVNGKSFGTKMPRVSLEIIGEYSAYLPSIEKQQEIVAAMTKVHDELSSLNSTTTTGKLTQQQILNQIFSA
jgi:type I restriction enzyme S subunit